MVAIYLPLQRRMRRVIVAGLLGMVLGALVPGQARAAASYNGFVQTDTYLLEIVNAAGDPVALSGAPLPAGLEVSAGTAIDVFLDSYGNGFPVGSAQGEVYANGAIIPGNGATPAAPTIPLTTVDDGTGQLAQVAGFATTVGGSLSDVITDGVFRFTNTTTGTFGVWMAIGYGWDIMVTADNPFRDWAAVDVLVSAGLADISSPDGILITTGLFEDGFLIDSDFGPDSDLYADFVSVFFEVAAGQTVYFATFSDIFGIAESVPLPATVLLFSLGLGVLVPLLQRHQVG